MTGVWRLPLMTALIVMVPTASAQQQDCSVFVRDAFNTSIRKAGASNSSTFESWQCASEFRAHQEALDSGLDVGVVVQGVPLQVGGSFDQSQSNAWKQQNCSQEQRSADVRAASYEFIRTYAPEAAALAAKCLDAQYGARAINCTLQGSGATPVFVAEWRRTTGDSSMPRVRRFTVQGGTCTPAFGRNQTISEGGTPSICSVQDGRDLVVALETTRGSCFQSQTQVMVTETIAGKIVLNGNRTYNAEIIDLRPDARIVTNGHQLILIASKEIKISGNPIIDSFSTSDSAAGRSLHGRPGGAVIIQAPKLSGSQLTVRNFGEDGMIGTTGSTGAQGYSGTGNSWRGLRGCYGASNGGPGGQGSMGGPGGNGGSGGPVIVSVKQGLREGAVERVLIENRGCVKMVRRAPALEVAEVNLDQAARAAQEDQEVQAVAGAMAAAEAVVVRRVPKDRQEHPVRQELTYLPPTLRFSD